MMARRMVVALAAAVVFALLTAGQLGCTPSDETDIGFAPPLTPGVPGPIMPRPAGSPVRPGGRGAIPAPVRGATVKGGELPKLTGFPGQFNLGDGVTFGSVRIFPIYSTKKLDMPEEYISLAEAQENDLVEISELSQGGTVNTVEITNKADKPIYVISGDIIKGGNQDRVIAMDMVIPPGKNQSVTAGVFCVERGRWSASDTGSRFAVADQACLNLKKSLGKGGVSQGAVWSKVGEINEKLGTTSGTDTYRRALEDKGVSSKLEPYATSFMDEFEKDEKIIGFAVCVGRKVLACDIFLNPSLLAKMREKLIRSYVMGALTEDNKPAPATATAADVGKFLAQAAEANVSLEKEDGNYKIYKLKHGDTEGFYSEVGQKKTHFFLGGK